MNGAGGRSPRSDVSGDDLYYGEKYVFDPDFNGPVRNRKCTDVICLGLFLAFLAGWGFVAYFAITQGDIDKVRLSKLLNILFL